MPSEETADIIYNIKTGLTRHITKIKQIKIYATTKQTLKGIPMKVFEEIKDVKEIRKKTGLNQIDFWGKVGVTQSGGSRYETGRKMPKPVRELLRLVHIERIELSKVNRKDLEIAALLKKHNPELYAELSKQTKSERKK